MITNPFIYKVLDISTAHITEMDVEMLRLEKSLSYKLDEYGWLVYLDEIGENWHASMSEAFRDILKEAKELGCDYVRFDRDGRTYQELPVFNW